MIGSPLLDKTCTALINIYDYFGRSKYPSVHRLYLDPEIYDKPPPLIGESIAKSPHRMQLRSVLEVAAPGVLKPVPLASKPEPTWVSKPEWPQDVKPELPQVSKLDPRGVPQPVLSASKAEPVRTSKPEPPFTVAVARAIPH